MAPCGTLESGDLGSGTVSVQGWSAGLSDSRRGLASSYPRARAAAVTSVR